MRVADGTRTHDLRNHNPTDPSSNLIADQQLTSSDAPACTNACTSSAENDHDAQPKLTGLTQSKWLELLAADPELLAVVQAWPELPDAVRAGIVAMVRAAGASR